VARRGGDRLSLLGGYSGEALVIFWYSGGAGNVAGLKES